MKVVFLAYLRGFGGAQRQIVTIANAMCELGHDVTLISLSADNRCYEINKNIKYIYIADKGKSIFRIFNRYKGLKKVLLDEKPELIVNFWFQSTYLTAIMKKKINSKIIYSERCDPGDKQYTGLLGMVRKMTLNKIDGFVFQTNAAKNYFDKNVQARSTVIPNPIFINRNDYKIGMKDKKIVTVGRLHHQKNMPLLINAFSEIADDFKNYILEIYGDGELEKILESLIKEKKLENRIYLRGARKDVHSQIVNASLFVLSSDYEGMPNALLEAMALGLPCISTDWAPGGIYDIINDGENGIIVPLNDSKKLVEAMKKVLLDEKLADKLSKNAVISSKNYNPEIIFKKWEKFFKKILNK